MLSAQQVAKEFDINVDQLIDRSLQMYLHQQLVKVETELFRYAQKFGVKNVTELDEKLQQGLLREQEIIDDFFVFDHLEFERDRLVRLLGLSS